MQAVAGLLLLVVDASLSGMTRVSDGSTGGQSSRQLVCFCSHLVMHMFQINHPPV